ncbi:MAG: DNA polymerase III subunit gamma/tau [Clostridia bacterium]|nr:DNA polymerase III subunit gamma/tau [Clostridia bacterium]
MQENSYKVLYRKWRPKIFDEVVGQKNVTDILKNQIISKKIPHALMFCGVRGTGKTSCAKIFAKAVNCLKNNNGNPCLKCENCQKIENGNVIDVYEIDAASNNGVENIRTIREESNFVSSELKFKVYIVDEFHMLSSGAFNAFLRTLEEPQKNVIFILATTEFNKIPKTIVSRCQKFDFHRISNNIISDRLKFISEKENININSEALDLIARNSDGAMRDALSILDQCSNYEKIDKNKINEVLGISGSEYIENLIENIINSDLKKSVEIIENLFYQGKNLARECENIINFFHDIIFFHSSDKFLENSLNNKNIILKLSKNISLDKAISCFKILEECYSQISKSSNQRAELEIAIIEIFNKLNNKLNNKLDNKLNNKSEIKTSEINIPSGGVEENMSNLIFQDKNNSDESKIELSPKKFEKNNQKREINNFLILNCWKDILEEIKNKVSNSLFQMLINSNACIKNNNLFIDTNNIIFGMVKKFYSEISRIVEKISGKAYKICRLESEISELKFENLDSENSQSSKLDLLIEKANQFGVDIKIN